MMDKYYRILELTPSATDAEVEQAFNRLKLRYNDERFLMGAAGNEAARKLEELEDAYQKIKQRSTVEHNQEQFGYGLADIDRMLRENKIDDAQKALDSQAERSAEWHYLQSIVFYKRNWYLESKKQLDLALAIEPNNEKYKVSLDRLQKIMASPTVDPRTINSEGQQQTTMSQPGGNSLSTCCLAYCLLDCCCNSLQCL